MWVKVDDDFPDHPKVVGLSAMALQLWLLANCWCSKPQNRVTSGFVPERKAVEICGSKTKARKAARELVDARGEACYGHKHGLWEPVDGGWRFHDWNEYQPKERTSDEEALRESRRRAGRKGAESRWGKHGDGKRDGKLAIGVAIEPIANQMAPPRQNNGNDIATEWQANGPDPDPDPVAIPTRESDLKDHNQSRGRAPPRNSPSRVSVETMTREWDPGFELFCGTQVTRDDYSASLVAFREHHLGSQAEPEEFRRMFRVWAVKDQVGGKKLRASKRPRQTNSGKNLEKFEGEG